MSVCLNLALPHATRSSPEMLHIQAAAHICCQLRCRCDIALSALFDSLLIKHSETKSDMLVNNSRSKHLILTAYSLQYRITATIVQLISSLLSWRTRTPAKSSSYAYRGMTRKHRIFSLLYLRLVARHGHLLIADRSKCLSVSRCLGGTHLRYSQQRVRRQQQKLQKSSSLN